MKAETITIIFFKVPTGIRYISDHSTRPDNRIIPLHSDKIEDAKEYVNEAEALKYISRFINLNNRTFETAARTVKANGRKVPYIRGGWDTELIN